MTNTQYYSHTCYVWHSVYQLLISNTLKIMMCAGLPQQQNQLSYTVLKAIYISLTLLHHRTKHIKKHKVIIEKKKGPMQQTHDKLCLLRIKWFMKGYLGFFSRTTNITAIRPFLEIIMLSWTEFLSPPKIRKNLEPSQTNCPQGAISLTIHYISSLVTSAY